MTPPFSGRCLCGAVAWATDAVPLWQGHCNCARCRRATGSAFASFVGLADGHWRWTGQPPAVFRSSLGIPRHFCPSCTTPTAFLGTTSPGEMHFYAGTPDRPQGFARQSHDHAGEGLPRVRRAVGLHSGSPDA